MAADPSEHVAQAKLLIAERRYQDAVRALRRALVSRPDHVEARLLLGTALLALERYDEVRAEMLALSRKVPKDARVQRLLGEAFLRGGKVDKAVEALRRALDLDPEDEPARELLSEAGEEVPPRSHTMERWFDPEQIATVQTEAPSFTEEVTGPQIALPEIRGAPTSVVLDPAFQLAVDETDSSELTRPAPPTPRAEPRREQHAEPRREQHAEPGLEARPARRPAATLLGTPSPVAPPQPSAAAAGPRGPGAPLPGPPPGPRRPSTPPPAPQRASVAPPAAPSAAVRAVSRQAARPARRDVTEQLDLDELEDGDSSTSVALDAEDLRDDSTGELPRAPYAPRQPAPAPAPQAVRYASTPPPSIARPVAGPPRALPPAASPAAPPAPEPFVARFAVDPFPPPPDFDASLGMGATRGAAPAPRAFGSPNPRGADASNQDRTNVRVASGAKKASKLPLIALGLVAAVLVLGAGALGVRALLAGRRAAELAVLVSAAEADGRPATLEAAIAALDAAGDEDGESVALLARLEATGVLEQGRAAARANALTARLSGDDAQLTNAALARTYLLLARGEIDGARRAAAMLGAGDELASEAARARALTALATSDLARAVGEARVSAAAAPGAARPAALLATLLSRSGDAGNALSTLDGVAGGSVSPAVRLARARVLLARRAPGDREAAAREAADLLGPLAATSSPFERAGAHLIQAELALAGGDLARAKSEVSEAQPAPADEGFGLARADVLAATGAASDAHAVLAALPPASSDPRRRARITAAVALATNDLPGAEQAIAQAGEGGATELLRGRIAEARGHSDEAKTVYERVPLDDAAMPAARTRLASLLLAAGQVRQASDALAPASARMPTDVEVVTLWARIRLELRDLAGARSALERALAAGVRSPRLLTMKAEVELTAGDAEAASTTLRGALALAPADATLQVALARALRRAGHAADARAAVDAALRLDAASADALLLLAELSTDGGDVPAANAAIARAEATGHAPAGDLARARVRVLVATGMGAAGVAAADAIARSSRDASLYDALGRLHSQAEQDGDAADAFAQALRLDERDAEAWIGKVYLALRRGDLSGASRGIERAVALTDARAGSPELRARIETARGRLRFEAGNFPDARARADAALALDARSSEAQLLIANIAIEQGGDPLPALRAAAAAIAPPAEAIGRLAQRLPAGPEACAAARRYLDAAPHGYDADAVRQVADRCH